MSDPRAISFRAYFGEACCERKPFYNFGAGIWRHPDFQNIDLPPDRYVGNQPDIIYDAVSLEPLPIESGSAKVFFFSHVNEHLPDDVNFYLFKEVYRCLERGGVARFVFPDFDVAYDAYQREDLDFFLYAERKEHLPLLKRASVLELFVKTFATRALVLSPNDGNKKYDHATLDRLMNELGPEGAATQICSGLRMDVQAKAPNCHINWWNYKKFADFLKKAGFEAVYQSAYLKSRLPPLRDYQFFDKKHPIISGYVEAWK